MKYENRKNRLTDRLSDKTEFLAVDFFRLIFAIGIVALHLSPLIDVNSVLSYFLNEVLTRLGVPFFFLVSGFFLQKKLDNFEKIKTYLIRLLQLYLIYTLLYSPQIVYEYIKADGSFVHNTLVFVRNFLFVGSYQHLWYFAGLVVATLSLYLVVNKLKLSDKQIIAIVGVLYVIGTIINAYIQPLQKSLDIPINKFATVDKHYLLLWLYIKAFNTTRNGIFFGFPYLFFGYLIAKNKEKVYRRNYFMLSLASFVVMTGEAFIVHEVFGGYGQDMLFTLLPTSILVFLFVLFIDCKNNQRNTQIAKHTRYMSVLYFGLHIFINFYVVDVLLKGFDIELHSMIRFIVVVILNYVAAEVIIKMSATKRFKWLKKFY